MLGHGSRASFVATAAVVSARSRRRPPPSALRRGERQQLPPAGRPQQGAGTVQRLAIVRRRPMPMQARGFSSNPADFHSSYHEAPSAAAAAAAADQQLQSPAPQETPGRWIRRKALEALLPFQVGEGAVPTLKGLARLQAEAGQAAAAVGLLERALAVQVEACGGAEDRPEVIETMRELVGLYGGDLGQPLAATQMGERLLVAVRRLADGGDSEEVASTMRDVGRLKGFVRDHAGKRTLLEQALAMQRRVYGRTLGGSEHHVEVLRTRLFLAAAQVAAAPLPPPLFSGIAEASSAPLLEEAGATVDFLLEVQQQTTPQGHVTLSLALLHAKALLEGELGRGKEQAELLQNLLALRERLDGPVPTHETLDTTIDLAEALARLKRREEARALLEGTALRLQEGLAFTPAQAVDVAVRSALAWGALGELGTRVRMLERAHDCQEIFLAGEASEVLVQTKLELAEAVRLTGDRQRADLLAAGAEEARARLQRQVGFALRDDPRRLRLAGMLEALGDRYV